MRVEGNVHLQVGVTSFGPGTCDGANINVFAQIADNDEGFGWIHHTVCNTLGYTNAGFCGGNECESDCDCNAGYECQCYDDDEEEDEDGSSSNSLKSSRRRFLAQVQQRDVKEEEEDTTIYANAFVSSFKQHQFHEKIARRQHRKLQSKSDKACKSVKSCKADGEPQCLDNGELSGNGSNAINSFLTR
jgi:hypothetical protein